MPWSKIRMDGALPKCVPRREVCVCMYVYAYIHVLLQVASDGYRAIYRPLWLRAISATPRSTLTLATKTAQSLFQDTM